MTSDKLASFSLGATKKSAFEKRKEELAAKRKEQEDALAAEQARFIEEFEGAADKPKRFVRAGEPAGRPGPRISAPMRRTPAARNAFGGTADEADDVDGEVIAKGGVSGGKPSALGRKGKEKGPSQMEQFMQELRREQVWACRIACGGCPRLPQRARPPAIECTQTFTACCHSVFVWTGGARQSWRARF